VGEASNKIRQDIEETRGNMAETLDAIGFKVNVPARAHDRLSRLPKDIKKRLTRVRSGVKEEMQQMQQPTPAEAKAKGWRSFAKDNPMYLVVGAFVIMALIGTLVGRPARESSSC
jgi:ElaB/YqjD/DUF883 family membrane-anchored ribosome-binding protein